MPCASRSATRRPCGARRCLSNSPGCQWDADILGIWIEQTEGAKFWMKVFTDLEVRGCQDILIAVTSRPEEDERAAGRRAPADDAANLHRASDSPQPRLASARDRRLLAAADAIGQFARGPWGDPLSHGLASWRRAWAQVIPFLAFHPTSGG